MAAKERLWAQQSLAHSGTCITGCVCHRKGLAGKELSTAYKGPCDDAREVGVCPKEMKNH